MLVLRFIEEYMCMYILFGLSDFYVLLYHHRTFVVVTHYYATLGLKSLNNHNFNTFKSLWFILFIITYKMLRILQQVAQRIKVAYLGVTYFSIISLWGHYLDAQGQLTRLSPGQPGRNSNPYNIDIIDVQGQITLQSCSCRIWANFELKKQNERH